MTDAKGGSVRVRESVSLGLLFLVLLGLEGMSLRMGGTYGVVLMAVLAALAVIVIAARADIRRLAVMSACGCAFVLSWNAVYAGPLRAGDLLIFVTFALVLVAVPDQGFVSLPWWVKVFVLVLVIGVLAQVYFPPDSGYLAGRLSINTGGGAVTYVPVNLPLANIAVAFKLVTNIAIIPLAFAGAVRIDRRVLRWLGISYALGCAVSGLFATADHFGGNFSSLVTGLSGISSRQAGLTLHPNYLAGGLTVAVPFAFWMLFLDDRRLRYAGLVALPSVLMGIYSSGSRGGTVAAVLAIALCIVVHPRTRPHMVSLAIGLGTVVAIFAAALPGLGAEILKVTRLRNATITDGSDAIRDLAAQQAHADFARAQLHGIGLQVIDQASQSYLGVLASGGLLLATGAVLYTVGGLVAAVRIAPSSPLAGMVFAALATTAALYIVEPGITDRFYYLPAAVLIAMYDLRRRGVSWNEGSVPARGGAEADEVAPAVVSSPPARHLLSD